MKNKNDIKYWTQQELDDMIDMLEGIDGEIHVVVTDESTPTSLQKLMLERMRPSNTFVYSTIEETEAWLDDDKQW